MRRLTVLGSGATAPATPGAPAARPTPSPAGGLPKLARAPIPSRIGTTNHALLVLALGEGSPSVSRSRLTTLVANSARRWRLDPRGPVRRIPRLGDGHDDVGFAAALVSEGALGTPRCCASTTCACGACAPPRAAARRARRSARASSSATSRCCPTCPGPQGPAHPAGDEYDLETVILHQLGHWAGNLRHTPVGCHDTPMVKGLGPGEWWRSPSDWHYDACGSGRARAASALDVPSLTHLGRC